MCGISSCSSAEEQETAALWQEMWMQNLEGICFLVKRNEGVKCFRQPAAAEVFAPTVMPLSIWVRGGYIMKCCLSFQLLSSSPGRAACGKWSYSNSSTIPTIPAGSVWPQVGKMEGHSPWGWQNRQECVYSDMDLPWADSSKDILLTGHDVFDGNEIYIAFGKYMNMRHHR